MIRLFLLVSMANVVFLASAVQQDAGVNKPDLNVNSDDKVDKTLRFNAQHEFTILQLSDMHYGDNYAADMRTSYIQQTLIEQVRPDMIVITGDAVSGYKWNKKDEDYFKSKWQEFTAPYSKYKVRYAYVFGNHDIEADLTGPQIGELDKTNPFSLYAGDPTADPMGASNYVLPVLSSYPEMRNQPSFLLWMFDTRKTGCDGVENSYGCIGQSQLSWYEKTSQNYVNSKGSKTQGVAFFHIPLPEYMNVWNLHMTYGDKTEPVACPTYNSGAFERFRNNGNIRATFCGHDHSNDYGGNYQGVELVYGRVTGYGSYGPANLRGGRVIKLKESLENVSELPKVTFETYIVQEDNSIVYQGEPHWQGHKLYQTVCEASILALVSLVYLFGLTLQ